MSTVILPKTSNTPLPTSGVPLMTAEEFFQKHENDRVELVRGIVKEEPMPDLIQQPTSGMPLMTADEFFQKHENDRVELVQGIVKETPVPDFVHGRICIRLGRFLDEFAEAHGLGRVIGNDSFIKVRSNPDSVRGPDLMFLSYSRLPKGKIPHGLLDVIPELVIEVRSPYNTWSEIMSKVVDYLSLGVTAVGVVNTDREAIAIYRDNMDEVHFTKEQDLIIPDVLPGFVLPLSKVFE